MAAIGIGVYAFVDASLRARLIADARQQVDYNLSVLLPGADPRPTDARDVRGERPAGRPSRSAGSGGVIADFGDGAPYEPADARRARWARSRRTCARSSRRGAARATRGRTWPASRSSSWAGGQGRRAGPATSCSRRDPVEDALAQLRAGLLAAPAIAIGVALLVAGIIARWLLRPVDEAGRAARRIAGGDLAARVPERGRDEFGRWAAEFNRMADSLETTVARLEAAQQQNRRFVADVAHELRTPLTALVAEASLLEGELGGPAAGRPPGRRSCWSPTSAACASSSTT